MADIRNQRSGRKEKLNTEDTEEEHREERIRKMENEDCGRVRVS
jgi:hypothetical protein